MTAHLPKISQVSRSIWRILGCNASPMTLQGTNVYLIGRGPKRILIEAGPTGLSEYTENVRKVLQEQNARVEHLILTHWHKDHVGGLSDLIPVFKDINGGLPVVYKFPRLDLPDDPIPSEYNYEELKEGKLFNVEGVSLNTIYTPGHTTDHASLIFKEENSIFCGDCLLGEGTGIFNDLYDYLKTLNTLLKLNASKIFPGHGPVIDNTKKHLNFNIEHQLIREKKIYNIIAAEAPGAMSVSQIVSSVYRGLSSNLQKQATSNIVLHLKKLVRENKIQQRDGRYFVNFM